jgi:2-polyprenyl-3-methyl-5-hydroxy-6-metoxy-1,4-benzoquinol methylase
MLEAPDPTPGGDGFWFAVVRCADCGLCFTNPRPGPRSISQFYPESYHPHRLPRRHPPMTWWYRLTRLGHRPRKKRHTLAWHGGGRLLDFGCGGGAFLQRMREQGWQVTGLDASEGAVRRVREQLGLRALVGSLPHPELETAEFDVITLWHSLEHVHAPLAVLREAHRLLAPGGKVVVAVPNIESGPFRWFGPSWFGLDLPRHLTHFSPRTLQKMLLKVGFAVGPVRMLRHSDWLRSSAKIARRHGRSATWQRCLLAKSTSRLATWLSYLLGQSDCMTVTAYKPFAD